jgi:peptidoglycan-associated lipoprotein
MMKGRNNMQRFHGMHPIGARMPATPARLALTATLALALAACATGEERYDWVEIPGPAYATQAPAPRTPAPAPATVTAAATPAPAVSDDFNAWANDRVYFDTDLWTLSPGARETLNRQAQWFNRHPGTGVRIEGNADERGSGPHNLMLGQRRAEAVRDWLINQGVAAARISVLSNGKTRPVEPGADPAALARNRNVRTVVVLPLGSP